MENLLESNVGTPREEAVEVVEEVVAPKPKPKRKAPAKKKEPNWKTECKKKDEQIVLLEEQVELLEKKCSILFEENQRVKKDAIKTVDQHKQAFGNLANSINYALSSYDLSTRK